MLAELLLPDDGELCLENCYLEDGVVVVLAAARQITANCRQCGAPSERIHSHYQRTWADLPCTAFPSRFEHKSELDQLGIEIRSFKRKRRMLCLIPIRVPIQNVPTDKPAIC